MALFVARPSRGSWFFFGLVALGALVARGYGNYERSVVRRDAPLSELAQDLSVCTFGRDSMWLLASPSPTVWLDAIGGWTRRAVSAPQDPSWPGRCVPLAERLVERLGRTPSAPEAVVASARAVQRSLQDAARDPFERVALADSDQLPRQLVELFDKVRSLSQGSREGWRAVPRDPERYGALTVPRPPPLRSLPPSALRPTLASGTAAAFFSTRDGALHLYDFSSSVARDTAVGAGVPVGAARDGALRLETDQGAAWALTGAEPRMFLAPPDLAIEGDPSRFAWDVAVTPRAFALLTLDHGSLRVRVTPREGPEAWTDAAAAGPDESASAAVIAPAGEGWAVTVLRSTVSAGVMEQYLVRLAAPAAPVERRHGPHAPPVVPAAPEAPRALAVEGPVRLAADVPLYDARVLTCASGAARYFALTSEQGLTVMRVEGTSVRTSRAPALWPHGREVTLTCDAGRALVGTSPAMPRAGYFVFTFDRRGGGVGAPVEPPVMGPSAALRAVVLVRDGLLAVESNGGALRALRQVSRRGGPAWEPAGLVALTSPAPQWTRTYTRVDAVASGDRVTLVIAGAMVHRPPPPPEGQDQPAQPQPEPQSVPYVTVAGTSDGGATFWSL